MGYRDPGQQREYQRQWLARRREQWFAGKSCDQCGSIEQLQIDHVDPKQKIDHRVWSWARERMLSELAKCQVLCHLCHVSKTTMENYPTRHQHGTPGMYDYGCRCDMCRKNTADRKQRWRVRTGSR